MIFRPTSSHERWLVLVHRRILSPSSAPAAEHSGGWRTANLWTRSAFFILGLVAVLMTMLIGSHLWPGAATILAGTVALIAGEWLMVGRRQFGCGIEESLEVSGITVLAYELWSRLHASETIGFGFLGAVLAIAGFRVLNPVLTTLSALAFIMALGAAPLGAGLACYAIAVVALMASLRSFRRPSYARMLDYLVIVMPVAGYIWSASRHDIWTAVDYRHAPFSQWLVPACSFAFAAIAFASGLRRRVHPPLIAGMLCAACCAYELRRLTGLSLEARFVIWGCALLLISTRLERYLRVPRRGFISGPLSGSVRSADALEIAGVAVLTPSAAPSGATPSFEGGGGQFGGGGAEGRY
jgi:hypothetical protein